MARSSASVIVTSYAEVDYLPYRAVVAALGEAKSQTRHKMALNASLHDRMLRFETDINDPFYDLKDYRRKSDIVSADRDALQQVDDTIKCIEKALASLEKIKSVQRLKPKYCVKSLTQLLEYLKSYASTVKVRSADDRLSCRDRGVRTKPFSGTCALQSSDARRQRCVDLRRRQAIERSARTVNRMEWWIRKSDRKQRRAYDDVMRPMNPLQN